MRQGGTRARTKTLHFADWPASKRIGKASKPLRGVVGGGMLRPYRGRSPTCNGGDGTRKGRPMSATQQEATLASYRDAVEDLMETGEPFGDVEDVIDAVSWLTLDQKAALWLFAFSLRDPEQQRHDARAHLAAVG